MSKKNTFTENRCYLLTEYKNDKPTGTQVRTYGTYKDAEDIANVYLEQIEEDEGTEGLCASRIEVTEATPTKEYFDLPEIDNLFKLARDAVKYYSQFSK